MAVELDDGVQKMQVRTEVSGESWILLDVCPKSLYTGVGRKEDKVSSVTVTYSVMMRPAASGDVFNYESVNGLKTGVLDCLEHGL
jgi:hypothetical protein